MAKNGKAVALVTGASSGIGEAISRRLVEAGYQVLGTSRRTTSPSRFPFDLMQLDVTSDLSVNETVAEVIRRHGRVDLLVNNAGFNFSVGGAEESSIQQAKDIFDTNFFGIVRTTLAVVPHMLRIPMKGATDSNPKPATFSGRKPTTHPHGYRQGQMYAHIVAAWVGASG